ncbi:hypothetical protein [Trinickia dinghuensis]|uniref:Uncharacterized protein n=1 Tax=Trinickia dinghuensis TaxID=2291023 RepID=A0A3D8JW58_9BURK|nr:hypothetical protein [Trinickia dinghuensis]RDU96935.1 hypothetical protein DWV00_19945 [Trinickia dinghuensis]
MAIVLETKVLWARYYREGYVVAKWETMTSPGGFWLWIRPPNEDWPNPPGWVQWMEDSQARVGSFPFKCVVGHEYVFSVWPQGGLSGPESPRIPVEGGSTGGIVGIEPPFGSTVLDSAGTPNLPEGYRLEFVERMPYTPLFLGAGFNVIKAQLLDPDGRPLPKRQIGWGAFPGGFPGLRWETDEPTITNEDGIAANRVYIPSSNLTGPGGTFTISVWVQPPASGVPDHHVSTVFPIRRARVYCSFARNWSHAWRAGDRLSLHVPPKAPCADQLVAATVSVIDDTNEPVRGLRMSWRTTPNPTSGAWKPIGGGAGQPIDGGPSRWLDWQALPFYESGFPAVTDDHGQSTVWFANDAAQITGVAPTVNGEEYPNFMVFTDVDLGTGTDPAVKLPLDKDGNVEVGTDPVPVTLPGNIAAFSDAAIWLNGNIVSMLHLAANPAPAVAPVPPEYFKLSDEKDNAIGYVKSDRYGNGVDSKLSWFRATGQSRGARTFEGGTLGAPRLQAGDAATVDDSLVAGGLALNLPAFEWRELNDEMQLYIYLEGYEPGTDTKKYGTFEATYPARDAGGSNGFVVVVDESALRGYCASSTGEKGRFIAQYSISKPRSQGDKQYSVILSRDLDTTAVDLPAWRAHGPGA